MNENYLTAANEAAKKAHEFLTKEERCPIGFRVNPKEGESAKRLLEPIDNPYRCDCDYQASRHERYATEVIEVPKNKRLRDVGGDSYKGWKPGDAIWLNVRCGSGKTTLFLDSLEFFREKGYRVMYIGSREQLMRQTKLAVLRKLGSPYATYRPECMDTVKDIENFVHFTGYQQLTKIYRGGGRFRPDIFDKHNTVVFVDECHWITSDALFSSEPDEFLNGFLKQFSNDIMVFMTATDFDCLEAIAEKMPTTYKPKKVGDGYCYHSDKYAGCLSGVDPAMYEFEKKEHDRRYDFIKFDSIYLGAEPKVTAKAFSFSSQKELIEKIKASAEKWLILVESKSQGMKLKELIPDSVFVFRETGDLAMTEDDKAEKSRISTEEQFKVRVLITTSILDVGTNISDDAVKNIVIDTWDPVTVVQFVGRKRGKNGVNLYFRDRDTDDVIRLLKERVDKQLDLIHEVLKANDSERNNMIDDIGQLISSGKVYFRGGKLVSNSMAVYKLRNLQEYLRHILWETSKYGDKSFLAHQLELFGLELSETEDVEAEKKEQKLKELEDFIGGYVGRELATKEYEAFCAELDKFGIILHRSAKKHEAGKLTAKLNEAGIPYAVENNGGRYTFSRTKG